MVRAAVALSFAALALAGCIEASSVICDDEHRSVCPSGTACAQVQSLVAGPLCVPEDAFVVCTALAAGDACTAPGGGMGTCFEAVEGRVCIPASCGDGLVDRTESCDDANKTSGDQCAADCRSDESCGNGVLDGVALEQCDDGNLIDHDGCSSRCRPERATWTKLELNRLTARVGAGMVFDISRRQAVMFGGVAGPFYFDDTWLWNGIGWARAAPASRPSPRRGHAMAYDAVRQRVVLFGGASPEGVFADTWEWDGVTWSHRPTTTFPRAREGAAMTYDSRRKRVVLFGGGFTPPGVGSLNSFNDTWEWDGVSWVQLTTPSAPEQRTSAAMAYDPKRGRSVLFGGRSQSGALPAVVWELDGSTWTSLPGAGPTARFETAMAWDSALQSVVLFGGQAGSDQDDLWSWNETGWTARDVTPRPAARSSHVMTGDPIRNRLIVFGGSETSLTTWEWDGAAWSIGALPDPGGQRYHQVALDPLRGRGVIIDELARTWESDGRSWIETGITSPGLRIGGAMTYDPVRGRTVVFGGSNSNDLTLYDDTWLWDGAQWSAAVTPVRPPARTVAAMAFDTRRGHAVMFGGRDPDSNTLGDTWIWDQTGWHAATPAQQPPARIDHAIGYDPIRGELVMFGGRDSAGAALDDLWIWTGTDWVQRMPMLRPSARSAISLVWDGARGRLVMFGGRSSSTTDDTTDQDAWEWTGTDWELVDAGQSPANRSTCGLFPSPDGAGVIMIGGGGSSIITYFDDAWRLRWEGAEADEACHDHQSDHDGDARIGCADLDCWASCTPLCPPGAPCDPTAPRCGDGICNTARETCRLCPGDCGACAPVCGNSFADAGETAATCPGDAP